MHVGSESAQRRLAKELPVTYVIFDLLWLDGHSLMDLPYDRAPRARWPSSGSSGERWQAPDYVVGQGAAAARRDRGAGARGRRRQAARLPLRAGPAQRRVGQGQERHAPGGRHRRLDAGGGPAPGPHRRAARRRAARTAACATPGRVGTGFTEDELDRLARAARPAAARRLAVRARAGRSSPRGAVFVEPELVAEVEFREWTQGGQLRAPSYKGLRDDKPADLVVAEDGPKPTRAAVGGRELKLSNLDKVLYPEAGFTKRDVIDYYARIAPVLLPHLEGRPLTLKRYPNGVDAPFFYEKNAPVAPARVGHDARRSATSSTSSSTTTRDARVAGQPRRPRAAHVARPRARRRRPRR